MWRWWWQASPLLPGWRSKYSPSSHLLPHHTERQTSNHSFCNAGTNTATNNITLVLSQVMSQQSPASLQCSSHQSQSMVAAMECPDVLWGMIKRTARYSQCHYIHREQVNIKKMDSVIQKYNWLFWQQCDYVTYREIIKLMWTMQDVQGLLKAHNMSTRKVTCITLHTWHVWGRRKEKGG